LREVFCGREDPRAGNARRHDAAEILMTALCGGNGRADVADFAEAKEEVLREFMRLQNGPPSHDTALENGDSLDVFPPIGADRSRGVAIGRRTAVDAQIGGNSHAIGALAGGQDSMIVASASGLGSAPRPGPTGR
jgi:hypothetical protein